MLAAYALARLARILRHNAQSGRRGRSMAARLGNALYWTANGLAVLALFIGLLCFVERFDGECAFPTVWAVMIWAAGRACLYLLAGR